MSKKNNKKFKRKRNKSYRKIALKTNNKVYATGQYHVKNKNKCMNKNNIIKYKSSYERVFMYKCDMKKSVLNWGYEVICIPYKFRKKTRKYFPDFFVELIDKNKSRKKYIVEVKPEKEKKEALNFMNKNMSIKKGKKKLKTYRYEKETCLINSYKWNAVEKYCKRKGYEFKIVSEKDLNII